MKKSTVICFGELIIAFGAALAVVCGVFSAFVYVNNSEEVMAAEGL
ncbi:MAG: hypothetical protein LUG24_03365 [Clostridiales bacterium]|nr:hypothetical protein [Clostridiales bacterium]